MARHPGLHGLNCDWQFGLHIRQTPFLCCINSYLYFSRFKGQNTCNSKTQFLVEHENGLTSCEDCPSCPPGQTLSIECGKRVQSSTMIGCKSCKPGVSFSSKYGASICTPCSSSCAKDQVVLQNCTVTLDIKCDKRCYSNDRYNIHLLTKQGLE